MSLSTVWTTPVPDANAARAPKASSRKRNHLRRLLAPVDDGTNHLCKDVGYGRPARCTRTGRGRLGTGPPQGEGPSREPAGIRYLVPPHRGARTDPPAGGPRGPPRVLFGLELPGHPPHAPPEPTPQQVDLEAPNPFFVDWIHEHHLTTLRRALADILGRCPDLRFSPREPVPAPIGRS